jgi:CRISPR/Cas system-associated exonuclease Cas4 (RecB family)
MTEILPKLLELEKARRGVAVDQLVFVGMADVADVRWCAMRAVLRSKARELAYFGAYLRDRKRASVVLGAKVPTPRSWLDVLLVGEGFGYDDIATKLVIVRDGRELIASGQGTGPGPHELDAKSFGMQAQETHAERYPSLRWHFKWDRYVVEGVADGLTPEFVYEFKTTGSRYLLKHVLPSAMAQADLYAFFFQRPRKRVQVLVRDERQTETVDGPADPANAEATLRLFKAVDEGLLPDPPRDAWKCRKCEFKLTCQITTA